jgi:hypothetical protein
MSMVFKCDPVVIGGSTITNYNEHNPYVYIEGLKKLPDDILYDVCKDMIWFSSCSSSSGGSDFHWMCDACFEECKRRGKDDLYQKAHKAISESI